jgi:hypothetical protein
MGKYLVEISDKSKNALKLMVELPIIGKDRWRALDKGVWSFNSGIANIIDKTNYKTLNNKIIPHKHLNLWNAEKLGWVGVTLWDFQGLADINQNGSGIVQNGWSVNFEYDFSFKATIITWRIVG